MLLEPTFTPEPTSTCMRLLFQRWHIVTPCRRVVRVGEVCRASPMHRELETTQQYYSMDDNGERERERERQRPVTRLDRNDCRFASLQANLLREGT